MAYVPPVSLPSAAGVDFGEGDVRHFSQGDAVTVVGLSNPTRQLAARDSIIAKTLNLVVSEVNNHEQIVPLPVYRLVIPPSSDEIVANHRIPVGYEARVLNAVISSTPVSADIELNIMWSTGFGNISGTTVMTTTNESTGGTTFSPAGEFIVQVKNKGNVTLDIVASIMVTMRPITDVSGALLPAATIAPPGATGRQGDQGGKGDTGSTGPPGFPGLVWRGDWTRTPFPISYDANDVVAHDFAGTNRVSSYVCLQSHIANGINEPQPSLMPSPFWDFIAEAGAPGSGGTAAATPVDFDLNLLNGTFSTQSDYVGADANNGGYVGGGSPSTNYPMNFNETVVSSTGHGMAVLGGEFQRIFYGSAVIHLPQITDGASINWTAGGVGIIVAPNGTIPAGAFDVTGSFANAPTVQQNGVSSFLVNVPGTTPMKVSALVTGASIF